MKRLALSTALLHAGCEGGGGPSTGPIGDGLEFLGLALVLGCIILVIGALLVTRRKP